MTQETKGIVERYRFKTNVKMNVNMKFRQQDVTSRYDSDVWFERTSRQGDCGKSHLTVL